jgi:methyl-accepting chemotaxis protein
MSGVRKRIKLADLSLTAKLALLPAVGVAALVIFAAVALSALSQLRIGSPTYQVIAENNLLLADVLPPPAYLVEADLVAHQMLLAAEDRDVEQLEELVAYTAGLHEAYDERQAYWTDSTIIDPPTRELVVEKSSRPGYEFLDLIDERYVPALRAGDLDAARALLVGPMRDAYDRHRDAVDEIVTRTGDNAAATEENARRLAADRQRFLAVILALTLGAMVAVCVVIARATTKPLRALRRRLAEIAEGRGDLTTRLDEDRSDELGQVAVSFNRFVGQLADTVERIRVGSDALLAEAQVLTSVSGQVSAASSQSEAQTSLLVTSSTQVAASVNSVVAASEEMQGAIAEIARSAKEAVTVAASAVAAAAHADEIMGSLGDSSAEITDVIRTITSVAEQTNLLALNATIEAARAGDAGKGFAVVASEVKELARETARATGDISARIEAMQDSADAAVSALHDIDRIIRQISHAQTIIASAVEQQTTTTREILSSVGQAAGSADAITQGIAETVQATGATAAGATDTNRSAAKVADTARHLRELVDQFHT